MLKNASIKRSSQHQALWPASTRQTFSERLTSQGLQHLAAHLAQLDAQSAQAQGVAAPRRNGLVRLLETSLAVTGCDNWPYLKIFEQIPMDSNIKKQPNGSQRDSDGLGRLFWMFLMQFSVRFTKIRTALPTMLHKLSELAGGANHVQRCSIEWCFLLFMTSLSDCSF